MMMMMIACITIDKGSVPFIEGLCAQIYHFKFENVGGLPSLLFFLERKDLFKKKTFDSRSRSTSYRYITVALCNHIRIHIRRDLVHLDSLHPPGVSSRPLGSQSSTPYVWCVCHSVCIHTHTPTFTPTRVFDGCCFHYFVRNSLVALLEAVCTCH